MPLECLLPAAAAATVTSLSTGGVDLFSRNHSSRRRMHQTDEDNELDEQQERFARGETGCVADASLHVELTALAGGRQFAETPKEAKQIPRVLGHGGRVFIFEQATQRFLSIAELNSASVCVMTAKPVSLFVCHALSPPAAAAERADAVADSEDRPGVFAFEHEGLPAFKKFISIRRQWRRGVSAFGRAALLCDGECVNRQSQFLWHADGTVKHVGSGLWLNVNRNNAVEVVLGETAESSWAALPTS
mmetsp:Transcript_110835/g.278620  ORF Transcript_110835/g.278620 Transcript_110835/m.278620 type:complete len:247 (-) Transcript_110835:76-816(-)